MSVMTNNELYETIQYHIDNKMMLNIERVFDDETDIIHGFPMVMSNELILMSVINDFHDEGFAILRLLDITDAYSKENDAFYEKICISENIGNKKPDIIQDITDLSFVLKQLTKYKGFVSIQCENQIKKCTFYLGKINTIEDDGVIFKDIGMDGMWDVEEHKILFEEITQITFGDNYSKMFYKYVKND